VQTDKNLTKDHPVLEEYPMRVKNDNYWTIIAEAMHEVITSNEGTGYRFGRTAPYSVAAKTGTAQVFGGKQYEKIRKISYEEIPEYLRDHSLIIAFAPVENPEIAVAVIVENDVSASSVARKVMDAYFELKQKVITNEHTSGTTDIPIYSAINPH
jgi:penicillin-binding protein 2